MRRERNLKILFSILLNLAPTADELKKMMKLHGGNYAYFYSKTNVTHMIANQLAGAKISDLKYDSHTCS